MWGALTCKKLTMSQMSHIRGWALRWVGLVIILAPTHFEILRHGVRSLSGERLTSLRQANFFKPGWREFILVIPFHQFWTTPCVKLGTSSLRCLRRKLTSLWGLRLFGIVGHIMGTAEFWGAMSYRWRKTWHSKGLILDRRGGGFPLPRFRKIPGKNKAKP